MGKKYSEPNILKKENFGQKFWLNFYRKEKLKSLGVATAPLCP